MLNKHKNSSIRTVTLNAWWVVDRLVTEGLPSFTKTHNKKSQNSSDHSINIWLQLNLRKQNSISLVCSFQMAFMWKSATYVGRPNWPSGRNVNISGICHDFSLALVWKRDEEREEGMKGKEGERERHRYRHSRGREESLLLLAHYTKHLTKFYAH